MSNQYDAAVIGAGVFGAWTALQLSRSGARVLLLDQHGPGNSRSSSGGETRIIRMCYGPDEIYTRSAIRSLDLWKGFASEIGQTLFQKTGVLLTSGATDPYLISTRETLARVGYRFEWLDHTTLAKRFPDIVFQRGAAAVYEPDSGILMARRSVQAVVESAQRAGVRYEPECAQTFTGGVLRTNGGDFHADTLVFACGPWLPKLFPKVLAGRIWPTRQPVFFFGPPSADQRFEAPQMPAWIAFREGAYAIPNCEGRGFKLALDEHGPAFDPETGERKITAAMLVKVRAILRKRFPALRDAPLLESRICQYENTSNGDFLIDRHPDFENVWLVGGGSGHGFKHGPFVGEYVTQQILGTGVAEPRFSLASKKTHQRRAVY
ncbi:MAG: FAD-dependent oxidoreductase [Bryobacteraceae bacterium]|jgi:monomeric sarcosine oxidase